MGRRRFAKNSTDVRHFRLVSRSTKDGDYDENNTPLILEPFIKQRDMRKGVTEDDVLTLPEGLESVSSAFALHGGEGVEVFPSISEARRGSEESIGEDASKDEDWNELDDDCYFPKDGYNYEQHLRRVTGTKLQTTKSNDKPASSSSANNSDAPATKAAGGAGVVLEVPRKELVRSEKEIKVQKAFHAEEIAVMEALTDDHLYEEIDDDDLDAVLKGGFDAQLATLWGEQAAEEDTGELDFLDFKAQHKARMAERFGSFGSFGSDDSLDDGFDEEEEEEEIDESAGARRERVQPAAASAADFEAFLASEYNDDEIGAIDYDAVQADIKPSTCAALEEETLDMYLKEKQDLRAKYRSLMEPQKGIKDNVPRVIDETKALIDKYYNEFDETIASDSEASEEDESKNWDCETVLSTLSNLSNRPGRITRITKAVKKPHTLLKSVQEDAEGSEEDAADESGDDDESVVELPDVVNFRKKGETPEERRERKAGVKEMRRICRKMKKETKETYKNEANRLTGPVKHGDVRQKLRVTKLS